MRALANEPVLQMLETRPAQYAVVARMTPSLKRVLGGLRYERLNLRWEIAEFEHRASDWRPARRCIVARRDRSRPNLVYLGALPLPSLVHHPAIDASGSVAFLRRPRRDGTAYLRTPRGLRAAEDSHPCLCGQCSLLGNSSAGLQFGDCFPAEVSARGLAKLDFKFKQTATQAILAAR